MDTDKNYLTREDTKNIIIAGLAVYVILMVAVVGLWICPKYFGGNTKDPNETGNSQAAAGSSEPQTSSSEENPSSGPDTPAPSVPAAEYTPMAELPAEWSTAAARDYVQQIFLTDVASWCRVDQQEFQEVGQISSMADVMNKLNSQEYGIPGGIWFMNTEFSKENIETLSDVYSRRTETAKGIYIAAQYTPGEDVEQLAQNLQEIGADVNVIPASVNLNGLGADAIGTFIDAMHSHGISAGIYFPVFDGSDAGFGNGVAACKDYIDAGVDCIIMSSTAADSQGIKLCANSRYIELLRTMGFQGAVIMEPVNNGTVSDATALVTQSIQAGCDGVAVLSIVGTSNRAKRVYNELINAADQGVLDAEKLKASTLRILNLRR